MDTVRLDPEARKRLMDDLDRAGAAASAGRKGERRGLRVSFRPGAIPIEVLQPSGDVSRFAVLPRNLAAWGMGFIHGRFVYPTSRVCAIVPQRDGGLTPIAGVVVHCRHLMGLLHEVAMRFDAPVNLNRFIRLTDDARRRATADSAPQTPDQGPRGDSTIVVVGDSACDTLVGDLLKSGLAVRREFDPAANPRQFKNEIVLAILRHTVSDEAPPALDTVRRWRELGFDGLILVLTSDDEAVQTAALDAGANAVLPPPHHAGEVLGWLERYHSRGASGLAETASGTPHHSPNKSQSSDDPVSTQPASPETLPATWPNPKVLRENLESGDARLMELVDAFFESLSDQAIRIQTACDENDFQTVAELCQLVAIAGEELGADELAKACRATISVLTTQAGEVELIRRSVRDILARLRRKVR